MTNHLEEQACPIEPFWGGRPLGRWDLTPFSPFPSPCLLKESAIADLDELARSAYALDVHTIADRYGRGVWPPTQRELPGILAQYAHIDQGVSRAELSANLADAADGYSFPPRSIISQNADEIRDRLIQSVRRLAAGYTDQDLITMTFPDERWRKKLRQWKTEHTDLDIDDLAYTHAFRQHREAVGLFNSMYADIEIASPHYSKPISVEGAYDQLMSSTDRGQRQELWKSMTDSFSDTSAAAASIIAQSVRAWQAVARAKNRSVWDLTFDHEFSSEVFDQMAAAIRNNTQTMIRFATTKAKLLGVPTLERYDVGWPWPMTDESLSLADALTIIQKTWHGIHPTLGAVVVEARDHGWILADNYSRRNQRQFQNPGTPDTHPYVSVLWNGTRQSFQFLAHELAHAVYAYLARNNPYVFGFYPNKNMQEGAALFLERLADETLMQEGGWPADRLRFVASANMISTLYANLAFHDFEYALYGAAVFDNDQLTDPSWISAQLLDKVHALQPHTRTESWEPYRFEWVPMFHLVRYPTYYWRYVTGGFLATIMRQRYGDNKTEFGTSFCSLLSAGSTREPQALFREHLGLDITKESTWADALHFLEHELNQNVS